MSAEDVGIRQVMALLRVSQDGLRRRLSIKMIDWLWQQRVTRRLVSDLVMTPATPATSCEVRVPDWELAPGPESGRCQLMSASPGMGRETGADPGHYPAPELT